MHPARSSHFSMSFDLTPSHVGAAQYVVMMLAREHDAPMAVIEDVRLAVDEVFAMLPTLESRTIDIDLASADDEIRVRVRLRPPVPEVDEQALEALVDRVSSVQRVDETEISFTRRTG